MYKLVEKVGLVLDIPEDKPWEKEKNIQNWLIQCKEKKISQEVAEMMVRQIGTDQTLLENELEKVILFVGERSSITVEDVAAVCSVAHTESVWKLGDALVARDGALALRVGFKLIEEGHSFFQLIRLLRSQFHTKYQVCSILSSGGGQTEVASQYPYMKGRILDQNCKLAHNYGMDRFRKAMMLIDKTEAMAKSQTSNEQLLIERLIAGLTL